jgi:glycosyltransferase involved in cell wall biosynthesis
MVKISVIVIAHNEASNICACLQSIQHQTVKPDEVVLVAHNCTDDTVEIAKEALKQVRDDEVVYRIVQENGPMGPLYARIRGFKEVAGEIIACIDGDSIASKKWLQKLISRFDRREILAVGGGVWLRGGLIPYLMSLDFFWLKPIYRFLLKFFNYRGSDWNGSYFWGANFAIRKSAYEKIGGLIPFIQLNQKLGLSLAPEDLYLALRVSEVGEIAIEPWAMVVSSATKTNWKIRSQIQGWDKQKLIKYINSNPIQP